MHKVIKQIELGFVYLEFYECAVISTIKEDVIVEKKHVEELRSVCIDHFKEKNFVYITNRKYNYNVNPVVYIDLVHDHTLKGIAVISERIENQQTARFEMNFSPVPFELFQNKDEAIIWASSLAQAN